VPEGLPTQVVVSPPSTAPKIKTPAQSLPLKTTTLSTCVYDLMLLSLSNTVNSACPSMLTSSCVCGIMEDIIIGDAETPVRPYVVIAIAKIPANSAMVLVLFIEIYYECLIIGWMAKNG